jgi:CDGSH-type Zn-finger protein
LSKPSGAGKLREFTNLPGKEKILEMTERKFTQSQQNGRHRTRVTLRHGEVIALCRCWRSDRFPLCDGSHKEKQDNKGPAIIISDCDTPFRNGQGD